MPGLSKERIPKRRKRVITPARKEQNRIAQRLYRQRQKERLQRENQKIKPLTTLRAIQPDPSVKPMRLEPVHPVNSDIPEMDRGIRSRPSLAQMKLTLDHFFPSSDELDIQYAKEQTSDQDGLHYGPTSKTVLPDLYRNTLELTHSALLRACLHNAQSLGISIKQFFSYECMSLCSPFYRANTAMSDDPHALIKNVSSPSTPAHLQPTLPQILFPHHPILDLLPWPALRTRAVMLAATAPTLVDAVDLKRDIVEKSGIVCQGEQPWDMHSWVAAPWFLKKWRLLLGHF
ncbi:hypothetical protein BDV26DRAFT_293613 [Aspergillus bertholletiae]|uniref:BZIP domain-containing protein n=1 Tax=Aspergillus bertholletiae TaxID=1226010 RepID=A0A5N7B4K6_9EURO|nr:hypothetical protein BDV26DRAFT_293613 [Aspergillus bertholletiae]